MSEEKNKKSWNVNFFFLVGNNFSSSEDSSPIEYSAHGLREILIFKSDPYKEPIKETRFSKITLLDVLSHHWSYISLLYLQHILSWMMKAQSLILINYIAQEGFLPNHRKHFIIL